jgi:Mn-containing catalase
MYLHTEQLINEIAVDEPDPAAANALQKVLVVSSAKCGR